MTRAEGEEVALAAATASGGDELGGSRAAAGEGAEERERVQRVRERREGFEPSPGAGLG